MHSELTYRRYLWIVLIPLLVGCGPVTATAAPTEVDMNAFSTQIAGTVVAQITQTAYVTPSETLPPTRTPSPTQTPLPVYALDGTLKASIIDGNLYVQNGNGENVQLTDSKADHNPIFSDDGKKIVFYRWTDNSFYSIDSDGSNEQKIFDIPSLAMQDGGQIKALTFIKNTHILLFNIYLCGPGHLYDAPDCFVSAYSVDIDSGKTEEIGQRVSGTEFNRGNFEISPNQKYLSVAGSGHINIFSFSSGYFKLAYFGALTYRITRPDEFLPYQYWFPDSNGLIAVVSADKYNSRGLAKKELKDDKGAIEDFTKAIANSPGFPLAYYNRGQVNFFLVNNTSCIEDFTKAIEIDPNFVDAYYARGHAKKHRSDYAGAIADFSKIIEIDPMTTTGYGDRASVKYTIKDFAGALEDFTKDIEINPEYGEAYNNRGLVKLELKDFKGAIADFTKTIELNPEHDEAHYNRGIAKIESGSKESGCMDLKRSSELGYAKAKEAVQKFCK